MFTIQTAILLVFLSCCLNVVFLELLIKEAKGSGTIITFAQFLFIASEGFIATANFGREKRIIPLRSYGVLVLIFFTVSVINNYALNFSIPMPLHMVFKSGSLAANMILGIILLRKRYTLSKYLSVAIVSFGIFLCTYMSALQMKKNRVETAGKGATLLELSVGVTLLILSLLMSAGLGIFQESLYAKYGKVSREVMFYSHALSLPGFFLLSSDILRHAAIFSESEPIELFLLPISIPKMWLHLIGNLVTQYVCVRSVFFLTSQCQSLTVTLIVTLRKFVSLVISILYFQNPFTSYHWIGALMVFVGTFLFSDVIGNVKKRLSELGRKNEGELQNDNVSKKEL